MTTLQLDGSSTASRKEVGELDGATFELGYPISPYDSSPPRIIHRYELFELHRSNKVHIQRQLIEPEVDGVKQALIDELLVWLKTSAVSVQDGPNLVLEVDGQKFEITPSSPQQRLVLQFEDHDAPNGIGEGFTRPLRVDGHATRTKAFEKTAMENLYIYGTAQFRARVFEQLALLDCYPELRNLLGMAQKSSEWVRVVLIMQLNAGTPQFGPGYYVTNPPPEFKEAFAMGSMNVLYDPYAAKGVDALTALAGVLHGAYQALTED